MLSALRCFLLVLSLLQFATPSPVLAAERVALVIGIAKYKAPLTSLDNPTRDSALLKTVLGSSGFEVSSYEDLDHAAFERAIDQFAKNSAGAKEALIFYSGHGMAVVQDNRLVNALAPADAQIDCKTRIAERVIALEHIIERLAHIPKKIAIFDACRNDPFTDCKGAGAGGYGFRELRLASEPQTAPSAARTTSQRQHTTPGEGAPIEAAQSLLVSYSSDLGGLALDGDSGGHSPFLTALLEELGSNPRMPFREVLDRTSKRVAIATQNFQIPWVVTRGGEPEMCLSAGKCDVRTEIILQRQLSESRKLAALASDALRRGDIDAAIGLALEGLPDPGSDGRRATPRGYAIEAHAVLERALRRGTSEVALSGHGMSPLFVSFNADGSRLVTSGYDQFAVLWDPRSGREVARLPGAPDPYLQHRLSPGGRLIVTLGARTLSAYSHDGKEASVWDAADGKKLGALPVADFLQGSLPGAGGGAEVLDFLDDDHLLLNDKGGMAIWRVSDRQKRGVIPSKLTGYVRAFTSPAHGTIALLQSYDDGSAGSSQLEIWNRATLKRIAALRPHQGHAVAAMSRDGATLLTGSRDRTVRTWDMATGNPLLALKTEKPVAAVAHSGAGLIAAATAAPNTVGDLHVWSVSTSETVARASSVFRQGPRELRFHPSGRSLFAADPEAGVVYSLDERRVVQRISLMRLGGGRDSSIMAGTYSPDGEWLAVAGAEGNVTVIRTAQPRSETVTSEDQLKQLHRLDFIAPEIEWTNAEAIVGTLRGELKTSLLGVAGAELVRFPDLSLAVTKGNDRLVRIWNLETGALLIEQSTELLTVAGIASDPNANRIVIWESTATTPGKPIRPSSGDRIEVVALMGQVEDAVERGRARLTRCLSPEARSAAGLPVEVPAWCRTLAGASNAKDPAGAASQGWQVGPETRSASATAAPVRKSVATEAEVRRHVATATPDRSGAGGRPRLGIQLRTIDAGFLRAAGHDVRTAALVLSVGAGTPAATAGLRVGDLLIAADNRAIESAEALVEVIARAPQDVAIEFVRIAEDMETIRGFLIGRSDAKDVSAAFMLYVLAGVEGGISPAEKIDWLQRAADLGQSEAMLALANYFESSPAGGDQAVAWYHKAADAGNLEAIKALATMYLFGRGVRADEKAAARWALLAAQSGDADSMHNYGSMLDAGHGVNKSPEQAAEWVFKAVLGGSKWSLKQTIDNASAWSPAFRRALQQRLKDAGLYAGPINASFGAATRAALEALAARGPNK